MLTGFGTSKYGRYRPWFFFGFATFAVSFRFFTRLDGDSLKVYWTGVQCIAAVGLGIMATTTLPCIQAPLAELGQAVSTAAWGFVRSFGGIWGIAIPAAIFNLRINQLVTTRLTDEHLCAMLLNGGAYMLAAGGLVHTITEEDAALEGQVRGIYVDGLSLC